MGLCAICGIAGVLESWPVALAPIIIGVVLFSLLAPDWGVVVMAAALFLPIKVIDSPRFLPGDVVTFLLIAGYVMQRLMRGQPLFRRTVLDVPFVLWLAIMLLSLVNAYDPFRGFINWLRHVQLILLFYAVYGSVSPPRSKQILNVLIGGSVIFALMNSVLFVQTGGAERVFGTVGISINGIFAVCIVYLTARTTFARSSVQYIGLALVLGLLIFGQTANMSRGALVFSFVGMIGALIHSWIYATNHGQALIRRRIVWSVAVGSLAAVVAIIVLFPMFQLLFERFGNVGNAMTTINYRLFLWRTALDVFLDNPILGIGLGQIQIWHEFIPGVRLDPIGVLTIGVGSHNTMLKYLPETGLLGIVPLLWLIGLMGVLSFRVSRTRTPLQNPGHVIGLWSVVLMIVVRTTLEGHTFYAIYGINTALFFALALLTSEDILKR